MKFMIAVLVAAALAACGGNENDPTCALTPQGVIIVHDPSGVSTVDPSNIPSNCAFVM